MVRWQVVMLRRLTLTLLLASIASSSGGRDNSNGDEKNNNYRTNNRTMCPENCRCVPIQIVDGTVDKNDNNNIYDGKKTTEVRCKVKVPVVERLPNDVERLVVEAARPREIMIMLMDLEGRTNGDNSTSANAVGDVSSRPSRDRNSAALTIRELALVDCSLKFFNVGLENIFRNSRDPRLNLTRNDFAEIEYLRIERVERLYVLDLSYNRLSRVKNDTFRCYSRLSVLNLRGNAIVIVENFGFVGLENLESLDLSENRIATLNDDTFAPLRKLQKLNLRGNGMAGILGSGHRWFEALGRLKELDVSGNGRTIDVSASGVVNGGRERTKQSEEIASSGTVALEALPIGLKILRLGENYLTDVELSLVLGSGRRLETVDASRIGLDRVPSALTRSVRSLTLAGNVIKNVRSGDFDSYPLLRLVDLSGNAVNNVEDDAFGRLENLEKLDLSKNRLIEIPQSLPGSLLHLILSHNSIVRLTAKDLQGVCRLKTLVISHNSIREVEVGSMSQLAVLEELDISDNPIKQLPANTFGGPRSLARARMSGLIELEWDSEKRADMAFPVPAPERLVALDLSGSPALAAQLLADEAALSACKSLRRLDLARNNLTSLRTDLAYLLPQLHTLGLSENFWNCTSANREDILWLAEWIRQHEEMEPRGKCFPEVRRDNSTTTNSETIFLDQLTIREMGRDNDSATTETIIRSSVYSTSVSFEKPHHTSSGKVESSTEGPNHTTDRETSIFYRTDGNYDRERLTTLVPNTATNNETNTIDTAAGSDIITTGSAFSDDDDRAKPKTANAAVESSTFGSETINSDGKSIDSHDEESMNSTAVRTEEIADKSDLSSNTSEDFVGKIGAFDAIDGNVVESINETSAEEFIGSDGESAKSLFRISDATTAALGTHPGMFVIVGAVLGAIVALSVVLSRRATMANDAGLQNDVLIDRESYRRHENIEVHPFGRQQRHQHQPIITDLW